MAGRAAADSPAAAIDQQGRPADEPQTPVLQVWEGVLALPIVGGLDTARAQDMTEAMLERVVQTDSEIVLLDEWHAGTYGIPDEKTIEAIHLCARLEGMLTDPVYEGKSMAALVDIVRSGRIAPGSRVLYAHLGGQPALNAYAGAF